jgi:hypothetical protein
MLALVVSSQDGDSPGFTSGNTMAFRYWDSSTQMEILEIETIYLQGNDVFVEQGSAFIKLSHDVDGNNIEGCTSVDACNHDPDANMDDGSCIYEQENHDCEGNCMVGMDCNNVCGGVAVIDECGICDGMGIADGACDCEGNVLDECNACGGLDCEEHLFDGGDCDETILGRQAIPYARHVEYNVFSNESNDDEKNN